MERQMLRRIGRTTLAGAVSFFCVLHAAHSAEFKKWRDGNVDVIAIQDDLQPGDEKKFFNAALSSSDAIVVFHSPGGSLLAGIEIGKAIRLKGFSTYVPDGMQCASACALAWLGGQVRFMSAGGRIGFHAAYTKGTGQPTVSSSGNALAGAYLSQLGLPNSAVIYITDAAPTRMQWLTPDDAQRHGIDVKVLNPRYADNGKGDLGGEPTAGAAPRATLWEHNDSVVYLVSKGSLREFYYRHVRPGMLEAGARPGSLLFRGRSANAHYSGTAFLFSRRCGQIQYQVSGPILDNFQRVVLRGKAPRRGPNCRVEGYRADTLEFRLLNTSGISTATRR